MKRESGMYGTLIMVCGSVRSETEKDQTLYMIEKKVSNLLCCESRQNCPTWVEVGIAQRRLPYLFQPLFQAHQVQNAIGNEKDKCTCKKFAWF